MYETWKPHSFIIWNRMRWSIPPNAPLKSEYEVYERLFIGDEVDVEFCVIFYFFALWVGRYGIEVSFCTYEE